MFHSTEKDQDLLHGPLDRFITARPYSEAVSKSDEVWPIPHSALHSGSALFPGAELPAPHNLQPGYRLP